MYLERTIAVDHGNRNMKTENLVFTSGLTVSEKQPPFGDYMIYEGKYYALTGQRIPYQKDKTKDERFFYLTLFAIVKELERDKEVSEGTVVQVNLPVGLPPKHYGSLYRQFETYFKRDGIQTVLYRRKRYCFYIRDVVAYPQDYAAAMTIFSRLKEYVRVMVIDLGGFTLDYLMLRNGQPDLGICDSLDNGVIKLYNSIASRISAEYDVLLEETDMDQMIQGKDTDYDQAVVKTVQEMARTFTEDFLGSLRERDIDLKSGAAVFVGGGAMLLESYIRQVGRVGRASFIPDLQANAKRYGILYRLQKGR